MKKLALALVFLFPISAQAGHCQQFFSYRRAAVVVVKQPIIFHQVGVGLSNYAAQVQQLKSDPAYLEFLKTESRFREFKAYQEGLRQGGTQQQTALPVTTANCAKCHGTTLASPRGDLFIGSGAELEAGHITKVMRWLSGKEEPPTEMTAVIEKLIREKQQGAVIDELLSLEAKP